MGAIEYGNKLRFELDALGLSADSNLEMVGRVGLMIKIFGDPERDPSGGITFGFMSDRKRLTFPLPPSAAALKIYEYLLRYKKIELARETVVKPYGGGTKLVWDDPREKEKKAKKMSATSILGDFGFELTLCEGNLRVYERAADASAGRNGAIPRHVIRFDVTVGQWAHQFQGVMIGKGCGKTELTEHLAKHFSRTPEAAARMPKQGCPQHPTPRPYCQDCWRISNLNMTPAEIEERRKWAAAAKPEAPPRRVFAMPPSDVLAKAKPVSELKLEDFKNGMWTVTVHGLMKPVRDLEVIDLAPEQVSELRALSRRIRELETRL